MKTNLDQMPGCRPMQGRLLYRAREHAFDFEPQPQTDAVRRAGPNGTASLAIDTLQLEVAVETGEVLFPWGYCPTESMGRGPVTVRDSSAGCLRVRERALLEPGVAVAVDMPSQRIIRDLQSGWVQVGEPSSADRAIMFASGSIACLRGTELVALQLHPEVIP